MGNRQPKGGSAVEAYYLCSHCKKSIENKGNKCGTGYCVCSHFGRMIPKRPRRDRRPIDDICSKFEQDPHRAPVPW